MLFQFQSKGETRFLNLESTFIKCIRFLHKKYSVKVVYHGLRRSVTIDQYPDVERLISYLRDQGAPIVTIGEPPIWTPINTLSAPTLNDAFKKEAPAA